MEIRSNAHSFAAGNFHRQKKMRFGFYFRFILFYFFFLFLPCFFTVSYAIGCSRLPPPGTIKLGNKRHRQNVSPVLPRASAQRAVVKLYGEERGEERGDGGGRKHTIALPIGIRLPPFPAPFPKHPTLLNSFLIFRRWLNGRARSRSALTLRKPFQNTHTHPDVHS